MRFHDCSFSWCDPFGLAGSGHESSGEGAIEAKAINDSRTIEPTSRDRRAVDAESPILLFPLLIADDLKVDWTFGLVNDSLLLLRLLLHFYLLLPGMNAQGQQQEEGAETNKKDDDAHQQFDEGEAPLAFAHEWN